VSQGLDRILPTYARADLTIVDGDGCRVRDVNGREYLDFGGGIAVVSLGHCHPAPLGAAHAQLDRLWHASNLYRTEPAEELAELLSARFGGAQAFFCNSGAESVEAALKYARKATGKTGVVALDGGFHGRTLGALSVTGQPTKREPFAPLVPGARFVPPNDVAALTAAVDDDDTGLILLEPVLGEGGVVPLEQEFVAAASALPPLLCLDEVQVGVGRTGTFFASEQLGIRPDLVTLAKGLANGLPIGALLVADDVAGAFAPGDHGSTFGGNPVAAAAACAVVGAIDDELLANVRARGSQLVAGLGELPVANVRGRGLLVGFETPARAGEVVEAARDEGLLVLTAGDRVVRLAPPLTVSDDEVAAALDVLARVVTLPP
jgi:acetylornithine aminotransferase